MSAVATQAARPVTDERWICKHCAETVFLNPERHLRYGRCPDCGYDDWHHSVEPVPEA